MAINANFLTIARKISMFNKRISDYKTQNFLTSNFNNKGLTIEREKFAILLKNKFPKINVDRLLINPLDKSHQTEKIQINYILKNLQGEV